MRTNFDEVDVSATQEDYLRAIYLLTQSDTPVSVTNLAKKLHLSKSTISERLKGLANAKLITQAPYGKVEMTSTGEQVGRNVTHKHRIIEVFLHDTLGMSDDEVHQEADRLEHALSDTVIKRLGTFLDNPTKDPHGSSIPKLN